MWTIEWFPIVVRVAMTSHFHWQWIYWWNIEPLNHLKMSLNSLAANKGDENLIKLTFKWGYDFAEWLTCVFQQLYCSVVSVCAKKLRKLVGSSKCDKQPAFCLMSMQPHLARTRLWMIKNISNSDTLGAKGHIEKMTLDTHFNWFQFFPFSNVIRQ